MNVKIKTGIISVFILSQLIFSFACVKNLVVVGDGFFSYTLANSPYAYDFIDHMIKHFPQENGWIDAQVLRDDYLVGEYNRFDFSQTYWHQRIDYHPLLYYSSVHLLSSIFPGTYSNLYVGLINLIGLLCIDILFVLISKCFWKDEIYAIIPMTIVTLCNVAFDRIVTFPRMYALLAAVVLWYLYIHVKVIVRDQGKWTRKLLMELIACLIIGTQTHFYFYVFAGLLSILEGIRLFFGKKIYSLLNYVLSGCVGISITLLIFPWMLWAILFNSMEEHDVTIPWSLSKFGRYLKCLNEYFLNGRWYLFLILAVIITIVFFMRKQSSDRSSDNRLNKWIWIEMSGSVVGYSLLVFRLDEGSKHYHVPEYVVCALMLTHVLIVLSGRIFRNVYLRVVFALAICVVLFGISSLQYPLRMKESYSEYEKWHAIAVENHDKDVIFVDNVHDNLFGNNWFELAQYRKFKVIPYEDYSRNGITEDDFIGYGGDKTIMVYLPEGDHPGGEAECLMTYRGFDCYKMRID